MVLHFSRVKPHRDAVLSTYRSLLRASLHINEICSSVEQAQCVDKVREEFRRFRKDRSAWRTRERLLNSIKCENALVKAFECGQDMSVFVIEQLESVTHHRAPSQPPQPMWPKYTEPEDEEDAVRRHQLRKLEGYVNNQMKEDRKFHQLSHKSELDQRWIDNVYTSRVVYIRARERVKQVRRAVNRPFKFIYKGVKTAAGRVLFAQLPWGRPLYEDTKDFIAYRKHNERVLAEEPDLSRYTEEYGERYKEESDWEQRLSRSANYVSEEGLLDACNSVQWSQVLPQYDADIRRTSRQLSGRLQVHNKKQMLYTSKIQPDYQNQIYVLKRNYDRMMEVSKQRQVGPYTDLAGESLSGLLNEYRFKSKTTLPALGIE